VVKQIKKTRLSHQPTFIGTDAEKQKAYAKWRARWFAKTQGRKILKDGDNKKGRPK
jgi:hypothetical protein